MSSIISNWSLILVTLSFAICGEAPGSVKMITRSQSKCEIQAIWPPELDLSRVPTGVLLLVRMAGRPSASLEHLGPTQATGAGVAPEGAGAARRGAPVFGGLAACR